MKNIGLLLLTLTIMLLIVGCSTTPIPPVKPLSLESFELSYTPQNTQAYSPTTSDPYPPFKMTCSLPRGPVTIIRNEQINRPYTVIGKMVFKKSWYDNETIAKMIRLHVPAKGGDAVSSYHMEQESAALMKDPDTGAFRDYYYGAINLELIRYTDK